MENKDLEGSVVVPTLREQETTNLKENQDGHNKLLFVLVMARKCSQGVYEYEWEYSESYDPIEARYNQTNVVLEDEMTLRADKEEDLDKEDCVGKAKVGLDEKAVECIITVIEPFYVGKAIFHTTSREVPIKIEGPPGWQQALKLFFHDWCAKSRAAPYAKVQDDRSQAGSNHIAAENKTVSENEEGSTNYMDFIDWMSAATNGVKLASMATAAANGAKFAVDGTTMILGALGFTAAGITSKSYAARMMSREAISKGGGVVARGVTSTLQHVGAVGAEASSIGLPIMVGGAIVGVVCYMRNQRKDTHNRAV